MIFLKGKLYPFKVDPESLKLMGVLPLTSVTELRRDWAGQIALHNASAASLAVNLREP